MRASDEVSHGGGREVAVDGQKKRSDRARLERKHCSKNRNEPQEGETATIRPRGCARPLRRLGKGILASAASVEVLLSLREK